MDLSILNQYLNCVFLEISNPFASILANLNIAVIWNIATFPCISNSSNLPSCVFDRSRNNDGIRYAIYSYYLNLLSFYTNNIIMAFTRDQVTAHLNTQTPFSFYLIVIIISNMKGTGWYPYGFLLLSTIRRDVFVLPWITMSFFSLSFYDHSVVFVYSVDSVTHKNTHYLIYLDYYN